jgi:GxxExxY protein
MIVYSWFLVIIHTPPLFSGAVFFAGNTVHKKKNSVYLCALSGNKMNPYNSKDYPVQTETSQILSTCIEVHRILGKGFLEIVYKDALEYEFQNRKISYQREQQYIIEYKSIILPHKFFADFVVFDQIILEVKAQNGIAEEQYKQVINYLRVSGCKIGLIINFGEDRLGIKRVIL